MKNLLIVFAALLMIVNLNADENIQKQNENTPLYMQIIGEKMTDKYYIAVSKQDFTLFLCRNDSVLQSYPIAIGKNPGDKEKVGDWRTPEGNFRIQSIEPSGEWVYNFGNGYVKAYGPWFIRLETGSSQTFSGNKWTGIGIHGTHDESSIKTRASRGCLRMHNDDLIELVEFLNKLPDIHLPVFIRKHLSPDELPAILN